MNREWPRPEDGGDLLRATQILHAQLAETPTAQRWQLPFPLGVFGTLRAGMANHHLMRRGLIAASSRAFLPHFLARGIELFFHKDASAPFEIYHYQPREWNKVIEPVDRLEEFHSVQASEEGYHRTLAWLALLPSAFDHAAFAGNALDGERNLHLAREGWHEYVRVPCWIYSSLAQNRLAASCSGTPILWDGVVCP